VRLGSDLAVGEVMPGQMVSQLLQGDKRIRCAGKILSLQASQLPLRRCCGFRQGVLQLD